MIALAGSAILLLGIAGISVLLGGRLSRPKDWKKQIEKEALKADKSGLDKEFLTTELTVLRCTKCGYYMFFDKMAQFSTKE